MPNGEFKSFESELTGGNVLGILGELEETEVSLVFPKLELVASFELNRVLEFLGMKSAFEPRAADFTGMTKSLEGLFISHVYHGTFLKLTQTGTEAAAATAAVAAEPSGGAGPDVRMVVDRPFIFAIVDRPTNTLLFLGHVLAPKAIVSPK